jgi:tyrosyl-tRNA synthetase
MFTKVMQVPDALLEKYATLTTDLEVGPVAERVAADPVGAHRLVARELVRRYHGEERVADAEERYDLVARGGIPSDLQVVVLGEDDAPGGSIDAAGLAVRVGFTKSKGEARRLIDNRGLRIDGVALEERTAVLDLRTIGEFVFQSGRNAYVRVRWGG